MKYCYHFLLLVVVIAMIQCRKDSLPFYMNSSFETETTATLDRVRAFTRNGEIMDTQLIRQFVERNSTPGPHHFVFNATTLPMDPDWKAKIFFRDNYTASVERYSVIGMPGVWETHEADYSDADPTQLLVMEKDSVNGSISTTSECESLINATLAVDPSKNCVPLNASTDYCKWKYTFPVIIENDNLYMIWIQRMVFHKYSTPNSFCMLNRWGNVRNKFASSIVPNIPVNDTVAIQVRKVLLRKL